VYPEDGFWGWYDGPCVVAEAPHPEAAYAFINHLMSAEMQAMLAEELGYSPTNAKAVPLMDAETRAMLGMDAAEKNISELQFQYDLGAETNSRMLEIWQNAKVKYGR